MKITVLASGSAGNAVLFEAGDVRVMVDAGIAPRMIRRRLREVGRSAPRSLDAVIITHAHGDHARHAGPLSRSFDAPLLVTAPIADAWHLKEKAAFELYAPGHRLELGELTIEAVAVPHDTPQVALFFDHDDERVALATDLGRAPEELRQRLAGCSTVLLESNHDQTMLARGPYPPHLKARVASDAGHLSNAQAAELLAAQPPGLRHVVLMHLSEANNDPELALTTMRRALRGRGVRIAVASQRVPVVVGQPAAGQLRLTFE